LPERGQEVEDPPAPDAHLLGDEHLEEAPDRAGAEKPDQPNCGWPRRGAQGGGERGQRLWPRDVLDVLAHGGARRLGHRGVAGEMRHALDDEGGLVERSAGQRAQDQLREARQDGLRLLVAIAPEKIQERLRQLPAHRVLGQRQHAVPEGLEGAEHDGRARRPRQHGARQEGQVILRVVSVDVLLAEQGDELSAQRLERLVRRGILHR
jgi:hypothetical protein